MPLLASLPTLCPHEPRSQVPTPTQLTLSTKALGLHKSISLTWWPYRTTFQKANAAPRPPRPTSARLEFVPCSQKRMSARADLPLAVRPAIRTGFAGSRSSIQPFWSAGEIASSFRVVSGPVFRHFRAGRKAPNTQRSERRLHHSFESLIQTLIPGFVKGRCAFSRGWNTLYGLLSEMDGGGTRRRRMGRPNFFRFASQ